MIDDIIATRKRGIISERDKMEKLPVIRFKKSAREKLLNQAGIAIGAYALQIAISVVVFIIIAMALSGTVLAPIMQQLMSVTDEKSLLMVEEQLYDTMGTWQYWLMSQVISAFMGALFATLSTGYIKICLMISRTEKPSIKDLFFVYKHNPDRAILLYLLTFAIQLVIGLPCDILSFYVQADPENTTLYLIYMVVLTITGVVTVIFSLMVAMEFYIYVDDPDMPVLDVFKKSIEMMKGNKKRLFALEVSFLGWLLLCILTCGVLAIWVAPYIQMAVSEFYRTEKGENLWISTSNYQGNLE